MPPSTRSQVCLRPIQATSATRNLRPHLQIKHPLLLLLLLLLRPTQPSRSPGRTTLPRPLPPRSTACSRSLRGQGHSQSTSSVPIIQLAATPAALEGWRKHQQIHPLQHRVRPTRLIASIHLTPLPRRIWGTTILTRAAQVCTPNPAPTGPDTGNSTRATYLPATTHSRRMPLLALLNHDPARSTLLCLFQEHSNTSDHVVAMKRLNACTSAGGMGARKPMEPLIT